MFDLQRHALLEAGVEPARLNQDHGSGKRMIGPVWKPASDLVIIAPKPRCR